MSANGSFKVSSDQKVIYEVFFLVACHIPKPCSCLLMSSIRCRYSTPFETESGEKLYSRLFGNMNTLLRILTQTVLIFSVLFFYFFDANELYPWYRHWSWTCTFLPACQNTSRWWVHLLRLCLDSFSLEKTLKIIKSSHKPHTVLALVLLSEI